jgi:ABC-type branched-subunit amino acid transport system ATPase component
MSMAIVAPTPSNALGVEVLGASKSFGAFRALDKVSIKVAPGTIHALLAPVPSTFTEMTC